MRYHAGMTTRQLRRRRPPYPDVLTPAEGAVVHDVRHGMTNRQIARWRGISLDAGKFHLASMLARLGVQDGAALRHWCGVPLDSVLRRREAGTMEPSGHLGRIGQISLEVRDIDRAVAWYRDMLGLRHLFTLGARRSSTVTACACS
jgi:DNA-binding CsgD family transcriptional regulator